ncbi:uncharacterized protein RSE6_01118 [Rhynchosporium secalis]|uniref:Uncharacterized protein n=1 Tax=Rhynchosporium secalis TaxID=38038 RepID=A0A1E1LYN4_RHYSE|nr:uncharacterized protein RSE6_01118 [Rhynchosporium secalis]
MWRDFIYLWSVIPSSANPSEAKFSSDEENTWTSSDDKHEHLHLHRMTTLPTHFTGRFGIIEKVECLDIASLINFMVESVIISTQSTILSI